MTNNNDFVEWKGFKTRYISLKRDINLFCFYIMVRHNKSYIYVCMKNCAK